MNSKRSHFGIVGGGMLGLTLSLRLAQRGHDVTLLEAADHVGGLADAWQIGDVTWDRHYHVTLMSDESLRRILRELGLDDDMQWTITRTGFIVDGRLHSFSSTMDFLRFPPLGLIDKARLGWTIWNASRQTDWRAMEQTPVKDWLIRHSGQKTFDRIWLPLLKAKLGDAWQRTSAAFIWATIQRMYAARRTGMKHEMFGYLPGGYARLLNVFRDRLRELGVKIVTGYPVRGIAQDDQGKLCVTSKAGDVRSFDRVIVTTPTPVTAKICDQLSAAEVDRLQQTEYLGIVCASLLLKKPLANYYVTNVTDAAPFTGVIEMSALVDPKEFGGNALVYLPRYMTSDDPAWNKSDEEIRQEFLAALERLYSAFSTPDVVAFRVSRVKHVFALSTLNYSQSVPPVATSVPGLFIVNSAQIVNGTLNVNETVRLAEAAIETVCQPYSNRSLAQPNHAEAERELVARPR